MKEIIILKETVNKIREAKDLFNNIKKINVDYNKENVILFCLNSQSQIIYSEVVFMGGLNTCVIDPKTLFRIALKHNSNSIMIAHNHPTGNLEPSNEDIDVYERLKISGDILSIKCLDSIIFNKKEFYSMGLLY